MNLDQAQQTFIQESRELLEQVEEFLLQLENNANDSEAINALFRAVHTIKGSAGLFGLDHIVSFAHVGESLLDKVRDGEITITSDLVAIFLSFRDHLGKLIELTANNTAIDSDVKADGAVLTSQMQNILSGNVDALIIPIAKPSAEHMAPLTASDGAAVETDTWHLSIRFGKEVLRNGMDPLSFIRYLATLGTIIHVTTLPDAMPDLAEMDPEACYLGFEIDFRGDVDKATLENVFEFVMDDATVTILPPNSKISEYIQLIKSLPEDNLRIGDLLVNSGAVTKHELEQGLLRQGEASKDGDKSTTATPLGEILIEQGLAPKQVVDAALDKQKQVRDHKIQESNSIRVDATKLDRLINLVGELVIAGASANLLAQKMANEGLLEATSVISRLVEEVRDSALQMRMVEIAATFNRFHRVVRDVSKEIGKDISLVTTGGETELDKSVVEKIGDPLMHLVRNAMDHGIEPVGIRRARGKSEKGTVKLNAYHESGSIVIEVSDDGGGLNKHKILTKALERGLINANHNLSDSELFNLIFEPGFSTAEQVTNLSGRGVGMDVVKRNIIALRGSVEIESEEGSGTTIRIRLPLTLAIIDGFLVGVADAAYVVPLDMVVECVELSEAERQATQARNYLNLRGEVLPFIRLRELFEVTGAVARRESIVVVQYGGQKAGLVVDELMGEFQTVIKPLGKLFGHLQGIGGSTILGSGDVALILDVQTLIQRAVSIEGQGVTTSISTRTALLR